MKNTIYLFIVLMFASAISKAQTTAMQLTGNDCNGNYHNLFNDLDSGKVVLLHFFMPNCSSCPPPAQKIQAMANHILASYPGKIKGYAMPFNNSATCTYANTWVNTNGLSSLYVPFDSGAVQVAHYGGFGMPTVVLLAGADHRVMFSTLSFSTSDTTIMRDSILAYLNSVTGIAGLSNTVSSFTVFPNPAHDQISIKMELKEAATVMIDIADITGKQVAVIMNERQSGLITKQFPIANLPNGSYLVRLKVNGNTTTQKLTVAH